MRIEPGRIEPGRKVGESDADNRTDGQELRIGGRNFSKRLFGLLVLERVKPGDGTIELLLGFGRTGGSEVHDAEFLRGIMTVWMYFLCDYRRAKRCAQK